MLTSAPFYAAVRPGHHPGEHTVYKMTASPRGITLIINNTSFSDHAKPFLNPRFGSEIDVSQVEKLFTALNFEVRRKENLTRQQLLKELDDVAFEEDHRGSDCFVLWVMSHGCNDEVFCSDGETIALQTLHDIFSKCDTLSGKPKLFFILACRGVEEDEGMSACTDTGISSFEKLSLSDFDSPHSLRTDEKPKSIRLREPTHADFLHSFSTVEEYVSYRDVERGSHYVRCLVEAFREREVCDHLLDILTVVNQKVSSVEVRRASVKNKDGLKICKQMPEVKHTLRKKVRF